MAQALRALAINRGGKNSVRNLRYGPRTRLVRGMDEISTLWQHFDYSLNMYNQMDMIIVILVGLYLSHLEE